VIVDQPKAKRFNGGFWTSDPKTGIGVADETRLLALRWVVRLRYGVIAGEIALTAALLFGLQIPLPLPAIGAAIAVQSLSNWVLGNRTSMGESAEHLVGALFVLDALCLTLILAFSGGPANPFSLLYLVQITFSAMALRRLWTWALGVISTVAFGSLFWIARDVPAFHEHGQSGEFSLHLLGMWIAFAAAALLISFFVGKLSTEAREKERELLLMQKRLAKNDRLASLVTLSAGAAHEMATPLATIAVTAKEIEREAVSEIETAKVREDAQLIRTEVERCRRILERMGAQGADPFGEAPRPVYLHEILWQVQQGFPAERHRIDIAMPGMNPTRCVLPVRATAEALSALVKNALDASPNGRRVLLTAAESEDGCARFTVRDEGTGMTPEVLERVAEPFFTTKAAGQGMGLGAFLAHLIAQTLGGQLSFDSEPGRGCTAILELPNMKQVR
jgi:two-component system sensor histidine kinase RegB